MFHALKTDPVYFSAVLDGSKTFEVRINDRDFRVGDFLALNELDDSRSGYTGRSLLLRITFVFGDDRYLQPGYVVLGFRKVHLEED